MSLMRGCYLSAAHTHTHTHTHAERPSCLIRETYTPIYVHARFIFLLSLGYLIVTLTHLWGEHARPQSVIELACDPTLTFLSIDIFLLLSGNKIPADQCVIPAGKAADTSAGEPEAFSCEPNKLNMEQIDA